MQQFTPRWIALLLITAIAIYLCWLVIQPFVFVLLWATVLAIAAYPLHRRLRRWGRGPAISAALTTLFVLLALLLPLAFIVTALVGEAVPAAQNLQAALRRLLDPDAPAIRWIDQRVDIDPYLDPAFLAGRLKTVTATVARSTIGAVGSVLEVCIQVVFVLFALYYLLRDSDRIVAALRDFIPLGTDEADRILRRSRDVISASLYGILVIAAIQGALGGLAFWFLGLSSPLLWGVTMFFLSMIPMAGAFLVWVPAAIYLLATGFWGKALILTLWGAGAIGSVDNFLRPRLVGERTKLHELVIFFSVLGGLQVFGVLGLVVGPVVVAITLTLIDVFRHVGAASAPSAGPQANAGPGPS